MSEFIGIVVPVTVASRLRFAVAIPLEYMAKPPVLKFCEELSRDVLQRFELRAAGPGAGLLRAHS